MTDNQQRADELLRGRPAEFHAQRVDELTAALNESEQRRDAMWEAKIEALAAAQEASSARWTEAISEADNDTDEGYFSGRAHAAEQAALRLRALAKDRRDETTRAAGRNQA